MFLTDTEILANAARAHDATAYVRAVAKHGLPLCDPASSQMTFLFDAAHTDEYCHGQQSITEVHLWINRLTDKHLHATGVMQQVSDTSWWVRTVSVPPNLRSSYCFRVNAGQHRPPGHNAYPHYRDPHARSGTFIAAGTHHGLSLLYGQAEQPHPLWSLSLPQQSQRYQKLSNGDYPIFWYAPALPFHNLPLIVLYDADIWFTRLHLDAVLDYAIATGAIPPCCILGVGFSTPHARKEYFTADTEQLIHDLAALTHQAATLLSNQGGSLAEIPPILIGQSLGALAALRIALMRRNAVSTIIASSPSFWWHPGEHASPADLQHIATPWITDMVLAADHADPWPMLYLNIGLREGLLAMHCQGFSLAAHHKQWPHQLNVTDGGHDMAWWREVVLDQLAIVVSQLPPAHITFASATQGSA